MSPMALISIQSGWDGEGKRCDLGDGAYTDVETVITHNIRNWIIEETRSLDEFDQGRRELIPLSDVSKGLGSFSPLPLLFLI